MNWLALGLGLAFLLVGLAFRRPMKRGVTHSAMPNPRFSVILYGGIGLVLIVWAIISWLVDLA